MKRSFVYPIKNHRHCNQMVKSFIIISIITEYGSIIIVLLTITKIIKKIVVHKCNFKKQMKVKFAEKSQDNCCESGQMLTNFY
ncbi:hypothetical protein DERF_001564 [Dermatophagoides farinae]|uniref:Uncharacterized protein n=1 Tax=Dermatophagoides farinae TaxID=6954 RepID=A0A922IAQ9_DERFA|nr:hypothetical protein DERF_001564 [Dermatophagoides farinae]